MHFQLAAPEAISKMCRLARKKGRKNFATFNSCHITFFYVNLSNRHFINAGPEHSGAVWGNLFTMISFCKSYYFSRQKRHLCTVSAQYFFKPQNTFRLKTPHTAGILFRSLMNLRLIFCKIKILHSMYCTFIVFLIFSI